MSRARSARSAHAVHAVHLSGGFWGLARMQARIARDQAYISARHRLPIPSSWSEDEAEGHIVPGSGNNTQTTRRAAGPLPPGDWLNLDPTNGTYGTFEGYFHGPGSPVYLVQKGQEGRTQISPLVVGVVHRVLGVLHRVVGVLRRVVGYSTG